jgi:hypothetical protein
MHSMVFSGVLVFSGNQGIRKSIFKLFLTCYHRRSVAAVIAIGCEPYNVGAYIQQT